MAGVGIGVVEKMLQAVGLGHGEHENVPVFLLPEHVGDLLADLEGVMQVGQELGLAVLALAGIDIDLVARLLEHGQVAARVNRLFQVQGHETRRSGLPARAGPDRWPAG